MLESINLEGKIAVVTGSTAGIGLAAIIALASKGARVVGVGRDAARCAAAEAAVRSACPGANVTYLVADLSLQRQVRQLAQKIRSHLASLGITHLDILINDAGLYSEKLVRTVEGVELTLAVNHIAAFLLTDELLPLLRAAPAGRVITISSDSHFNTWMNIKRLNQPFPYVGLWAYKVSKLANILFTLELNKRLAGTRVNAFAVDPGLVNTHIASKGSHGISSLVWNSRRTAGVLPEVPARTILYLAGEPSLQAARDFYWHDLHPANVSRQGRNELVARALWKKSLQICGISQDKQEVSA